MRQPVRSRKFDVAFVVIAVIGIADMLWEHSIVRPNDGWWWMWVVLVGMEHIGAGLAMGWAAAQPKGEKMTRRERGFLAGALGVVLLTQSTAQDSLDTNVSPWFLGLSLLCASVGFYAFTPLRARHSRKPTSIG